LASSAHIAVTVCGCGWSGRRAELPSQSAGADDQSLGDLLDIEVPVGGGHDQLERRVIVQVHGVAVEVEEDDGREPGETLVAVYEGVVAGQ
jgi:hypothetical protein